MWGPSLWNQASLHGALVSCNLQASHQKPDSKPTLPCLPQLTPALPDAESHESSSPNLTLSAKSQAPPSPQVVLTPPAKAGCPGLRPDQLLVSWHENNPACRYAVCLGRLS